MRRNTESLSLSNVLDTTKISYILGGTVFSLYLLMVMGTFVTSTGSGLACPDWPLCYGTVRPPLKLHIWFEWGHRLLGGFTGLLIILSTFFVWLRYRGTPRLLTSAILVLLFAGVLMGGVTVLIEAPHLDTLARIAIVSSHLIISTLVLISLIFTLRRITTGMSVDGKGYHFFLFCIVYLQVILGIIVRYSKASLACPDLPFCNGQIIPSVSDYAVALHFFHRVTAAAVLLLTIAMLYRAVRRGDGVKIYLITFALVLLQATFGALIVLTGMFLPVIIMHGATGFLLLGWLAYQSAPYLFRHIRGRVIELGGAR